MFLEAIKKHRRRVASHLKDRNDVHVLIRERGIQSGYRPLGTSFKSCLASLTVFTNETLNVWTHTFPALMTLCFTLWFVMKSPSLNDLPSSTFSWPCIFFLVATTLHLTVSALAHTFNSLSFASYQIWFFCDYTAISITGLSIAVTNDAYAFSSDYVVEPKSLHRISFLPIGALMTVAFTYFTCSERYKMNFKKMKGAVLSLSILHYFWVYYPVVVRILNCTTPQGVHCETESIDHYYRHLILMTISGLVFGLHIPEILFPGRFDIVGHSHQIFHVLNFMASIAMFLAIRSDMDNLKMLINSSEPHLKNFQEDYANDLRVAIMFLVPLVNISIMSNFIRKLLSKKQALSE